MDEARLRRRSESASSRRTRRTSDCEDDLMSTASTRRPLPRRGDSGFAPPAVTVRATVERNRAPSEPILRDEARAQIMTLEEQFESVQLRLMQNRILESREDIRRSRMRAELESLRPQALFGDHRASPRPRADDNSSPRGSPRQPGGSPRQPGGSPRQPGGSPRQSGGARLLSSMGDGSSGSVHNDVDERVHRTIQQRLRELSRDTPSEPAAQISPMFPPSPVSRTQYPPRQPWRRRSNIVTSSAIEGDSWGDTTLRPARGLWRLEDSLPDNIDSDLEASHEFATPSRRHMFETVHRNIIGDAILRNSSIPIERMRPNRSPEQTIPSRIDTDLRRERIRQVWGDLESEPEDYESPLTTLFQRSSWANSDITSRHELDRPSPSTALDRTSAERSYEPDSNARTQLQQLQIDNLFRDHMAAGTTQESHHARRVRNARASQRFRERAAYREFQREMPIPLGATVPSASLDNQKGRPEPLESEDMKLDCECKICFGQIADTLLLPCSHLVICQWCADQIGARSKDQLGRSLSQALCPMCRGVVLDRIKIFRG